MDNNNKPTLTGVYRASESKRWTAVYRFGPQHSWHLPLNINKAVEREEAMYEAATKVDTIKWNVHA